MTTHTLNDQDVAIVSAYASNPNATPESIAALRNKLMGGNVPSSGEIDAARDQLRGSTVFAGDQQMDVSLDEHDLHTAKIWPHSSVELRRKFMALIEKHGIKTDKHGRPIPKKNVTNQKPSDMFVIDPINGKDYKMLRRHIDQAYDMTPNELVAMFDLPADFKMTGPAYSEQKRLQAARIGLGTEKRGKRGASKKRQLENAA